MQSNDKCECKHVFSYFLRASSFVPPFSTGSDRPVSKFTLDTGFCNRLSPIRTSLFKFDFVDTSTEASVPSKVSSYPHIPEEKGH